MQKFIELGDPVLRKIAEEVDLKNINSSQLQSLISSLQLLVRIDGVGLAAPQIGTSLRIFIMYLPENKNKIREQIIVINPKIISVSKKLERDQEGCLSLPGYIGFVVRPQQIKVEFFNEFGQKCQRTFNGFNARIFQHEYDHLEGILYIDRILNKKINSFYELEIIMKNEIDLVHESEIKTNK